MIVKKILLIGAILSISPSIVSCDSWFSSHQNPFSIEEIANKKSGRKVYIAGEVIRTIYLVQNGAYLLQDNTGEMWILTSNKLPDKGDRISVLGTIQYQKLPFNTEELYLQEIEVKPYSETKNN